MKQMGFWRMDGRHRYIFKLLVIFIALLLQLRSVSGLHCYECTSEDPGCDRDVASTPALKKDCGEDARGCVIYAVYYDYVYGGIFHRSCVYSYDFYDFQEGLGWINARDLSEDGVMDMPTFDYEYFMDIWNRSRIFKNPSAKSVIRAKHSPSEISGAYRLRVFLEEKFGELSNGQEFSKWVWPGFEWDKTPKKIDSLECYSCEFEINGMGIISWIDHDWKFKEGVPPNYNLPPCSSMDASPLKKVTCKNAYGCATFLEMKNASKVTSSHRPPPSYSVSRVWRGCWYPGDQKCLRNPNLTLALAERTSTSKETLKGRTDMESKDCESAYERAFKTGNGVVIWAGVKPIESSQMYNEYLECRHKVRLGVNAESQLKPVEEKVHEGYTWIQYQFCGPKSKCNKYEEVDGDKLGKEKYKAKDYEDVEAGSSRRNRTVLDRCITDEEKSENKASLSSIDSISLFFLIFLTCSIPLGF